VLVLLVEFVLDLGELSFDWVLILLALGDLIVELILAFLALFEFELDVSRALSLSDLALEEHDLAVQALLLLLGDVSCEESVFEPVEFFCEVFSAALESSPEFLDFFILCERGGTFALASSMSLCSLSLSSFLSTLSSFSFSLSCWTSPISL
jgi:hypothetical protein